MFLPSLDSLMRGLCGRLVMFFEAVSTAYDECDDMFERSDTAALKFLLAEELRD